MPLARIGDADIHYDIVGLETGDPVLLVAGLGGVAGYWKPNLEAFGARHRVVLHDHRGTGRSTRSDMAYSIEGLADDLLRLMDHLGIARAHLVGHSTGGAMGLVLAATAPERIASLVLNASWATPDAQMTRCLKLRRTVLTSAGTDEYHRTTPLFLYPPRHVTMHDARVEREISMAASGSTSARILESRINAVLDFDGLPYLDRIHCPTLVLVADDDILTPPHSSELLAQRIVGARLVRTPYGGHALSRVTPDHFNETALAFLAQPYPHSETLP